LGRDGVIVLDEHLHSIGEEFRIFVLEMGSLVAFSHCNNLFVFF